MLSSGVKDIAHIGNFWRRVFINDVLHISWGNFEEGIYINRGLSLDVRPREQFIFVVLEIYFKTGPNI